MVSNRQTCAQKIAIVNSHLVSSEIKCTATNNQRFLLEPLNHIDQIKPNCKIDW